MTDQMGDRAVVEEGRLAENVVYFARTLRDAGLRIGPASVVDAIRALEVAGIGSRDDLFWTLHSVLVMRREDHAVFEEAFRLFWRSRDLVEKMIAMFSPTTDPRGEPEPPKAAAARVSQALFQEDPRAHSAWSWQSFVSRDRVLCPKTAGKGPV